MKRLLSWFLTLAIGVASYAVFTNIWPELVHRLSGEHDVAQAARNVAAAKASANPNPFASAHGQQLVIYFFTASDCGWSRVLENHHTIRSLRTDLQSRHSEKYEQVTVVAVDLDQDLQAGLTFLTKIGDGSLTAAFDQVIIGGSWFNDRAVRLMWQDQLIKPLLPQILAVERDVSTEAYGTTHTIGVGSDRMLSVVAGQSQIMEWIKLGYPLDYRDEADGVEASPK